MIPIGKTNINNKQLAAVHLIQHYDCIHMLFNILIVQLFYIVTSQYSDPNTNLKWINGIKSITCILYKNNIFVQFPAVLFSITWKILFKINEN